MVNFLDNVIKSTLSEKSKNWTAQRTEQTTKIIGEHYGFRLGSQKNTSASVIQTGPIRQSAVGNNDAQQLHKLVFNEKYISATLIIQKGENYQLRSLRYINH